MGTQIKIIKKYSGILKKREEKESRKFIDFTDSHFTICFRNDEHDRKKQKGKKKEEKEHVSTHILTYTREKKKRKERKQAMDVNTAWWLMKR